MNLYEFTGLGRPLDPAHRSNRLAIALTTTAAVATAMLSWLQSGSPDLMRTGTVAVAVFLAWAIGREIDPDEPTTANVAMVIAWLFAFLATPALIPVTVILFGVRMAAGTVGTHLRPLDHLLLIGTSAFAGSQPVAWPAIFMLAYAVRKDPSWVGRWTSWAIAVGGTIGAILGRAIPDGGTPSLGGVLLLIGVAVVGLARSRVSAVHSTCDASDAKVRPGRVSTARIASVVAVVAGAMLSPGLTLALGPAAAPILALAIPGRPIQRVTSEANPTDRPGRRVAPEQPLGV